MFIITTDKEFLRKEHTMPIPLPLLQKTAQYIAQVCLFNDTKKGLLTFNSAGQHTFSTEILRVVRPLIRQKTNTFTIGRSNNKLKQWFIDLEKEGIVFPKAAFVLYHDGTSRQIAKQRDLILINLKASKRQNKSYMADAKRILTKDTNEDMESELIKKFDSLTVQAPAIPKKLASEIQSPPVMTPSFRLQRTTLQLADFLTPEQKQIFGIVPRF